MRAQLEFIHQAIGALGPGGGQAVAHALPRQGPDEPIVQGVEDAKGVIWAGVSAGSNQAGTIVTGQAITSSPVGWGWALRPWLQLTINTATVSNMARE